ncbi:MAG: UbiA family prenyltransferase [Anaerolineales bacterium]|nr:UbiA family prenyltransferase [Anaerolineales bacterium]
MGRPYEPVVWVFGMIAMLSNLGEEIAADALDMEGDQAAGSRSLAILFGPVKALRISTVIFGAVVLLSLALLLFGWISPIYSIPLLLMDAIILYAAIKLAAHRTRNRRFHIRLLYTGASIAMLLFLVMRFLFE